MENTVRISVLIPTYNRSALLQQALASVFAQTHTDIEVIVVDDGSTESRATLLGPFENRVLCLRQERAGIGAARNLGLNAATGQFLALLDNDDLWLPDKLQRHLAFALEHADCAVTYTDATEFTVAGDDARTFVEKFPALRRPDDLFGPMILNQAIPLCSAAMLNLTRVRAMDAAFSSQLGVDDLGLFLTILGAGGAFAYLPEALTRRRLHATNTSGSHRNRFAQRIQLYAELLGSGRDWNRAQRRLLAQGRRDARYRVAECDWAELDLGAARRGFLRTAGLDRRGLRAMFYAACSCMPARWIESARAHSKTARRAAA